MKSLKNLIIPFIVMIVLVIVAVAVIISNNSGTTEESDTDSTSTDVLVMAMSTIKSLEVVHLDGTGIGFQSYLDDSSAQCWELMDKYASEVEISSSGASSWVAVLSNFTSNATIGDSSELNLNEYSLENPLYTIIITQEDGTVTKLYVGSKTVDESSCYFMLDGDPNVYTIAAIKNLYCGYQLIDFLETQLLDIDYDRLATVEFIRAEDNTDFVASCEVADTGDAVFTAISPYQIGCSTYFSELVDYIANLEITSFIELEDDQLAEYGIEEPAYTFIFKMKDGQTITINLSTDISGFYYGTCTGVDGYFQLSDMQISGLNTSLMILLDRYLVYYSASDMSSITGTYGDISFTYDIDTDSAISDETATAKLNMRDAKVYATDTRTYAAILYESLVTISITGVDTTATPEYDPEVTFKYVTKDYENVTLGLVVRDASTYYAFLNGEYTGFLISKTEIFHDGGENTFDYGAWTAYELTLEAIDNQVAGYYSLADAVAAAEAEDEAA